MSLVRSEMRAAFFRPQRILTQHIAIVLHRSAAARGIDNDGIEPVVLYLPRPSGDVGLGGGMGGIFAPHVVDQGTAAGGPPWRPPPRQPWRVRRRTVASLISGASTFWAQPVISATLARRVPSAGKAWGRSMALGDFISPGTSSSIARQRSQKLAAVTRFATGPPVPGITATRAPNCTLQRLQCHLGVPAEHHRQAEAPWPGQDKGQDTPQEAVAKGAPKTFFDSGAGMVHQVHVVDARRAGGHAGEAREAAVDVGHELGRGFPVVLQQVLDQVNPPARAVQFVAQQHISGAGRGAEAAMDAAPQDLFGGGDVRVGQLCQGEVGLHGLLFSDPLVHASGVEDPHGIEAVLHPCGECREGRFLRLKHWDSGPQGLARSQQSGMAGAGGQGLANLAMCGFAAVGQAQPDEPAAPVQKVLAAGQRAGQDLGQGWAGIGCDGDAPERQGAVPGKEVEGR